MALAAKRHGESWVRRPFEPGQRRGRSHSEPPSEGRIRSACVVVAPRWLYGAGLRDDASQSNRIRPIVLASRVFRQNLIRQSAIMAAAAKDSRLKRCTLTNLYNECPTWLKLAHETLDLAVLTAYAAVDPHRRLVGRLGGGLGGDWGGAEAGGG